MSPGSLRIPVIIGAIIAVLLQAIVAPFVTIGYAQVNFILVYVVVIALVRARNVGYVTPFVLGLIYDLMGSGPIGAMALLCTAITFVVSTVFVMMDNETLFIPIVLIVASMFVVEILYGILMIACGVDVSFADALMYRCLPCGLYDTVVALVFFPLAMRFVAFTAGKSDVPLVS